MRYIIKKALFGGWKLFLVTKRGEQIFIGKYKTRFAAELKQTLLIQD